MSAGKYSKVVPLQAMTSFGRIASVASVKKSFTLSFLPPGRVALIMVMMLAGQQNVM